MDYVGYVKDAEKLVQRTINEYRFNSFPQSFSLKFRYYSSGFVLVLPYFFNRLIHYECEMDYT